MSTISPILQTSNKNKHTRTIQSYISAVHVEILYMCVPLFVFRTNQRALERQNRWIYSFHCLLKVQIAIFHLDFLLN
uniref:Uncharacterized protein n=1 Tax=Lepeophtheirus salmonis TaxID=72036 RepID=A0A0K2UVY7_LEPSM